MSFRNPSPKLFDIIAKVRREESVEKINALDSVVNQIDVAAQTDACIRCQNAEWTLFWNKANGTWDFPELMLCRASLLLFPNENGFGFKRESGFLCTAENTSERSESNGPVSIAMPIGRSAALISELIEHQKQQRRDQTPRP